MQINMKRILVLLALALALVGCKKDKYNFKEADLVGVWFCTEWVAVDGTSSSNPDISFEVNPDHTSVFRTYSTIPRHMTWAVNGNKLVFSEDAEIKEVTLKQLDKKHLVWIKHDDSGQEQSSFINLSNLLPGRWKSASLSFGQPDITMDASGTSTWVKGDAEPEIIKWSLVFGETFAYPCIKWEGVNVDFADLFKVTSVTDDKIIMRSSNTSLVTFTRE